MSELFDKRMNILLKNGSLGSRLVEESEAIEDKLFSTDINYRKGNIYDWDMNLLEKIDFKFEKAKTHTAEGYNVEYYIHFRPGYNPEEKYKGEYYLKDGKERIGFYIDVFDYVKKKYEKWLIVGKDDRTSFDRYNAFKCNWCFEWINDGKYFNCIGALRSSNDANFNAINTDDLGGSTVEGNLGVILPTNKAVSQLKFGTRFIISDSPTRPQVYQVTKIRDVAQPGVTKLYLTQHLFNGHIDYIGNINDDLETKFIFDLPIDDLPSEYGGQYHMICNCVKSKGLPPIPESDISWALSCTEKKLYYNGAFANIRAINTEDFIISKYDWHIFIDGIEYKQEDLTDYFDIKVNENIFSIKCINKVMVNYIVEIRIYDMSNTYFDSVNLEVSL